MNGGRVNVCEPNAGRFTTAKPLSRVFAASFAEVVPLPNPNKPVPERHWYLKECRLLERLPAVDLQALETACVCRRFAAQEVIYLPADKANAVLAVISGRVKLCQVTRDGRESILAFIEPGEIFGELCLIDAAEREELAIATTASVVVLIPRDKLQTLIDRHAELAQGVTKLLGLRRLRIERRLRSLLFRPVRERLVQLLLELAGDHGVTTAQGIAIRVKLSHQDLASIIGSSRESVTTTLGELQESGLVLVGRQRVTICSLPRLEKLVE